MYEYDASLAYISLEEAPAVFQPGPRPQRDSKSKWKTCLPPTPLPTGSRPRLGTEYMARDWMLLNRNLFSALRLEKTMMFLLLVLITLVASFNIVGTLTMIVNEKQREIAILKAMGATPQAIMRIFMLNGLVIGLNRHGDRHTFGVYVSLPHRKLLDLRSNRVFHFTHSGPRESPGRDPGFVFRHSDQHLPPRCILRGRQPSSHRSAPFDTSKTHEPFS